jgi:hypothetical protein
VGDRAATGRGSADGPREEGATGANPERRSTAEPPAPSWAALMRRAFGFDVLACTRCGHAMRLLALIEQPEVIRRILRHLGKPADVTAPARAPPPLDVARGGPERVEGPLLAAGGEGLAAGDGPGIVYDRESPPSYDEPC